MRKLAVVMLSAIFAVGFPLSRPAFAGHGHGGGEEKFEKHLEKEEKHEWKHHGGEEFEEHEGVEFEGPFFRSRHRVIFGSYFAPTNIDNLPPGLRKHIERTGHLPPGLEKQLIRNGTLPPGLEANLVPLPPPMLTRFGPLPPYSRMYLYGNDAVLMDYRTHTIIDVMRGIY